MKNNINYSIGLDIGTNSVGWAVTDDKNNLIKANIKLLDRNPDRKIVFDKDNIAIKKNIKRNLWGSRLFDSAVSAAERRGFRTQRRRLDRRKYRIYLLQCLLNNMVKEKDEYFFLRMKESFLQMEDKSEELYFPYLFKETKGIGIYQRGENRFATIYHLRQKLINNEEQADPRLVYLAIHHIIKYRGNFLYEGQDFDINNTEKINEYLSELFEILAEKEISVSDKWNIEEFFEILKNRSIKNKDKVNEIKKRTDKDKIIAEITNAVLGYSFNFAKIIELEEDLKIKFSDKSYEEKEEEYITALGDNAEILMNLKSVYDWYVLFNLIGDNKYLSDSMVAKYEKYHNDLKRLKQFIKKNCSEKYEYVFNDKNIADNYVNYGFTGHREKYNKKTDRDNFYKFITKIIEPFKESENLFAKSEAEYFLNEIENKTFLNKQRYKDNGTIPYQLHKAELEKIIDNQGVYYPELRENRDKIISLLTFRVPYYVGPLNEKSIFSWAVRNHNDKITPWTFGNVVNTDASAEEFIIRMTNKCTYLPFEDVMPKNSLLYSEYCVFNELNKIKINGKTIDRELKNKFFDEVFKSKVNVKEKDLRNFLIRNSYPGIDNKKGTISGYADEKGFIANMKSYIDFKKILGEVQPSQEPMIEEIIRWITLFEDKKILKRKIENKYGEKLEPEEITKICRLNYTGWSRLSEKLLKDIKFEFKGIQYNLIDYMYNSNKNFMEIINGEMKEALDEELKKYERKDKITYEDVDALLGSPALKRGIWQTLLIIDEIVDYMGCEPNKIYLEFAREEGEKQRTSSRYKKIAGLYKEITDSEDFNKVSKELFAYSVKDRQKELNNDRLYLYFIQGGKCMYTGKGLEIDELDKYEVDHILPQSLIKDDSIENRCLVLREQNQGKGDMKVLPPEIRGRMNRYWTWLHDSKLIGDKKYYNLQRSEFNEDDLGKFINRQLVETRQIIKNVVKLLQQKYENRVGIYSVKAELTHYFREQFGQYKIREINDCHHAQDAYIACVIGNFIQKRFPFLDSEFRYDKYDYLKEKKNRMKNLLDEIENLEKKEGAVKKRYKYGFVVRAMNKDFTDNKTGEIIWEAEEGKKQIFKTLNYKDYFITKKPEENNASFYDINPLVKHEKEVRIPMGRINGKFLDPKKYGGYSGETKAYFAVVEYEVSEKKKKEEKITKKRELIGIPIQKAYLIKSGQTDLYTVCCEIVKKNLTKQIFAENSLVILKQKILKYQLILQDNSLLYITSQDYVINGRYFILDRKYHKLIYELVNNKLEDTEENNRLLNDFYDYYMDELDKSYKMYVKKDYINKLRKFKSENKICFDNLTFDEKLKFMLIIIRIITLSSCNLDLKKNYGMITGFGMLSGYKLSYDTIFIDQSVTGIHEKAYKV